MIKKKNYKYDLKSMEDLCMEAYLNLKSDDSEENKTKMFTTVRDLAFAILNVGSYSKYRIDFKVTAYEYSVYLFERIITNSFVPKYNDRFPWQKYISLNIKHIILSKRSDLIWKDIVNDLNSLLETHKEIEENLTNFEEKEYYERLDTKYLAKKLLKGLHMFYTYEEIKRCIHISLDFINRTKDIYKMNAPEDIKAFTVTLVSLAKRIVNDYNINKTDQKMLDSDLQKVFTSSVRSTIFLSAISNSNIFPKEIMMSLDIESLYRLSYISGGKEIRIPTLRELDSLIGSVVSVSSRIMEGKNIEQSLKDSKKYGVVFNKHFNVQNFTSKLIESYAVQENTSNQSVPLLNMLLISIRSLEDLISSLPNEVGDPDKVIKYYADLSTIFSKFTDNLINISNSLEKEKHV